MKCGSVELTMKDNRLLRYALESYIGEQEHDIAIFYSGPNDGDDRQYAEETIVRCEELLDILCEMYREACK
tara:strand:- start:64 stop:276 length:213 start_codon:yes stop_codon:yes gene_type:complete